MDEVGRDDEKRIAERAVAERENKRGTTGGSPKQARTPPGCRGGIKWH